MKDPSEPAPLVEEDSTSSELERSSTTQSEASMSSRRVNKNSYISNNVYLQQQQQQQPSGAALGSRSLMKDDWVIMGNSSHTAASHSSVTLDQSMDNDDSVNYLPRFQPIEETLIEVPDEEPLDADAHYIALNFVMEDRIFLKAALDLLAERDRQAPELGMMDPIVIKSGSLKKASLVNGVWKVKFVEIRRGMFSYYENAVSKDGACEGELLRKDIPLEASSCTCRAVQFHEKARNFTPTGAIFEVSVSGSKKLWMAKTRADRQLWMQTIHNAMVGGSVTRGDSMMDHRGVVWGVSPRSPYKSDLRKYMKAQSAIRSAKTRNDYILGLRILVDHSLKVPVKWIAKQGVLTSENLDIAFREEAVDLSVEQLWRDMQRDSVSINGELFRGDVGHGAERIVGALVREILGVGRNEQTGARSYLQASQALAYARDILLSGNRTRSGGDSYFCVNTLCSNPDLIVIVPSGREAEPVIIDVVEDESDVRVIEKSGWIKTRSKSQREWHKLFFVLSEGTLSFYESAHPRPHRLRGQIVLTDTSVTISKVESEFVLKISKEGSSRERSLLFASKDRLLDWTYALECSTKIKSSEENSAKKPQRRKASMSGTNNQTPSKADILSLAEQSTKEHATSLGLDGDVVDNRLASFAKRAASSTVVSIRACTEYKICTLDPQGDEQVDTWATIRAHFLQSFRLSGGANGRILRGEEIVRVSITDCIDIGQDAQDGVEDKEKEPPTSPKRQNQNRRIFRRFSTSEEVEEILKTPSVD